MARVFFTGAFRRPREINWVVGRAAAAARPGGRVHRLLAARRPAVGHRPADHQRDRAGDPARRRARRVPRCSAASGRARDIIGRLYPVHILLIPAVDRRPARRCTSALVWRQKHTQFPGRGADRHNVVGVRVWPAFAMKSIGLLFLHRRRRDRDGRAVPRQRRSGCTARTTPARRRRTRSPTGTSASSRARCACSRRGRRASAGS